MSDKQVLIFDVNGVPAATLNTRNVVESGERLLRELIAVCDDQKALAQALIRNDKAEGIAATAVTAYTAVLLASKLSDVARRLQAATGFDGNLAELILGDKG